MNEQPASPHLRSVVTTADDWRALCLTGEAFAVLGAARAPAVLAKWEEVGKSRSVSLYRDLRERFSSDTDIGPRDLSAANAKRAPYLFQLDGGTFEWFMDLPPEAGPRGILVRAQADLDTLRRHLRRFLVAKGLDGRTYVLRFYDPRVLPAFLASCNAEELADLFGPISVYGVRAGADIRAFLRS